MRVRGVKKEDRETWEGTKEKREKDERVLLRGERNRNFGFVRWGKTVEMRRPEVACRHAGRVGGKKRDSTPCNSVQ